MLNPALITPFFAPYENIPPATRESLGEIREELEMHSIQVGCLARRLSQLAGFKKQDCERIGWGGYYHDMGKADIPPEILLKKSVLTVDEWNTIKKHPLLGLKRYGLYGGSMDDPIITDAILSHHEKWDGSGYPNGISGKQIPKIAQIVSLADVIDALGANRCYRKKWPTEAIYEHIFEQRGKAWSPDVADLLLSSRGILT